MLLQRRRRFRPGDVYRTVLPLKATVLDGELRQAKARIDTDRHG
jgi:hypothetical protein